MAGIKKEAQSPARRISWTEEGEGDVTRASAVGADVWTPHVSDWKEKKVQRVPVCAGWADAGPLRARERGKEGEG